MGPVLEKSFLLPVPLSPPHAKVTRIIKERKSKKSISEGS